jgi:hypothetical protein
MLDIPILERPLEWRIASAEAHDVVGKECETCELPFDRDDRVLPVKDDFYLGEAHGLADSVMWYHPRCYADGNL